MSKKRVIVNILAPILGLAVIIGIWCAVAASIGKSVILPTPLETLKEFFSLLGEGDFYAAVGMTLLRTFFSFVIAFLLACLFSVLSYKSDLFKRVFSPFALMMRVMPTIAIILLVLIWFKSDLAPYVITFFVIFPMLYTTVYNALKGVNPRLLEMTQAYRFSLKKKVFNFYIPQMAPALMTGASITLPFCVKLTVAAEVMSYTENSVGRFMKQQYAYLETATLLAWTIVAILLGFLLEGGILLLKRYLIKGQGVENDGE